MTGHSRHDELRRLAEVAQALEPGPWRLELDGMEDGPDDYDTGSTCGWVAPHGAYCHHRPVNEYIAAVSPDVLHGLLDEVAAAEARLENFKRNAGDALDEWSRRALAAEARAADAEREWDFYSRQLAAVDEALPPWEAKPPDGSAVGRVQTIKNLRAERARADKATQALREVVNCTGSYGRGQPRALCPQCLRVARAALADLARPEGAE